MSQIKVSSVQNLNGTTVLDVSGGTANLAALTAGTTAKAPLTFTAGNILTTPADGSIEFKSSNKQFFVTSDATAGQAFMDESYVFALASDRTIEGTVVLGTFYSLFGQGLAVNPGVFFVDIGVGLRTGATSHTVSFAFGGTATYGAVQFRTSFVNLLLSTGIAVPGTPLAPVDLQFVGNPNSVANGVISPASTTLSKFFTVRGLVVVTGAGRITPQVGFSANPTGTNQTTALSFMRISPFGSTTLPVSAGSFA